MAYTGIIGLVVALNSCVRVTAFGFSLTNDANYYDDNHSTVTTIRIRSRSDVEPILIRFESDLNPMGADLDPIWIRCGSDLDPMWIRCGSDADPIWIRCGSDVDPMWIRCGSDVEPMWPMWAPILAALLGAKPVAHDRTDTTTLSVLVHLKCWQVWGGWQGDGINSEPSASMPSKMRTAQTTAAPDFLPTHHESTEYGGIAGAGIDLGYVYGSVGNGNGNGNGNRDDNSNLMQCDVSKCTAIQQCKERYCKCDMACPRCSQPTATLQIATWRHRRGGHFGWARSRS